MSESDNKKIVKQMYADFGQGHIPDVLKAMTANVVWKQPPSGPSPFAGTIRGREQLGKWFGQMDAVSEVEAFEPQYFIAEGDMVVVLGKYSYRATATGRNWESDWAMVWVVKNGKIERGQIFDDTLAQAIALSGTSDKGAKT